MTHGKRTTEPGPERYTDLNPDQKIAVRPAISCMLQLVNAANCREISGSTEVVEAPYIAEIVRSCCGLWLITVYVRTPEAVCTSSRLFVVFNRPTNVQQLNAIRMHLHVQLMTGKRQRTSEPFGKRKWNLRHNTADLWHRIYQYGLLIEGLRHKPPRDLITKTF